MKDLILVESKTARQQVIGQCNVLDKVKALPYLTRDVRSTIKQAADYYEVNEKTIKRILAKKKEEFSEDGIEIVSSDALKNLKVRDMDVLDLKYSPRLTLLTKRAILRIGMLLTGSEVAKSVRNYLLNLEEVSTLQQREWSLQRELGKLRRRTMTDAIRKYIPDSPNKQWRYRHFTDLAYQMALGRTAKELRIERCAKNNDQLRDKLAKQELADVENAETAIAGLLRFGFSYEEIKAKLNDVAQLKPTGTS